jgi:ABC-type amino acid transport substrate-binding protein
MTGLLLLITSTIAYSAEERDPAYERVMRTGTIKCGYYPWPPYFENDLNTGEMKGLTKDISDEIFALLGWEVEYIELTLGYQLNDLQTGKIDAICGDGPFQIGVIDKIGFTRPLFFIPVYPYVRSEDSRFTSLPEMNRGSVTFVAIDSDLSQDLAMRFFPEAKLYTLQNITDPAQMFLDVATKKADAAISDPLTAEKFIKSRPDAIGRAFEDRPLAVYSYSFSVMPDEAELREVLNTASGVAFNFGIIDRIISLYDPEAKFFIPAAKNYEINN